LTLGQQSIWATYDEVKEIILSEGIRPCKLEANLNLKTKIPGWQNSLNSNFTNAEVFFKLLGVTNVFVLDISNYENADIICNLNYDIRDNLINKFDIILDCGTIEHIFNVRTAMENISKMLKPGGRVILMTPTSNFMDHGFYSISPTFFFDYYSQNNFTDMRAYIIESYPNYFHKCKLYKYHYERQRQQPIRTKNELGTYFTAKKVSNSTSDVIPTQGCYMDYSKYLDSFRPKSKFLKILDSVMFKTRRKRPIAVDNILRYAYEIKNKKSNPLEYLGKI
jgi:SAM-dependent methyltransferase